MNELLQRDSFNFFPHLFPVFHWGRPNCLKLHKTSNLSLVIYLQHVYISCIDLCTMLSNSLRGFNTSNYNLSLYTELWAVGLLCEFACAIGSSAPFIDTRLNQNEPGSFNRRITILKKLGACRVAASALINIQLCVIRLHQLFTKVSPFIL